MKNPIGALLLCTLALATTLNARPAPHQSRIAVEGLEADAQILIDRWGVPHIYAANARDAFYAQGWNAARDRLWQIDLWRRSGLGELSAALGAAYVAQDRATRLFVYRGDMDAEWASYGADSKSNTAAFVAGINAYIGAAKADPALMPLEFKLAGYEPALWRAEDVVRIRNHGLALAVVPQVWRAQILCKTGNLAAANLLLPIAPPWTAIRPEGLDVCSIPPNVLDQYQLAQKHVVFGSDRTSASAAGPAPGDLLRQYQAARSQGSNNWAVGPGKSATHRPILANDPHRSLEVPSLRYIAHLIAPGLNVIGAGEPALPGISIGHNEDIAFGLTVFPIAQEDLYVYETNPGNPDEYLYGGGWESMRVLNEQIAVRGASDVRVELKFTRHGPVVLEDREHHRAYAVRATWLDTGGAPYFGALRYMRASNAAQFEDALRHWGEPGENQVYADTTGRIGWFPAGFTPVRSNSDGLLPLPGDGRYEWGGYLDRSLLPSEIDPTRQYIATANQMNLPEDYPYTQRRVSFFWADSDRFERINEVLGPRKQVTLKESEQLQNDDLTLPGQRLIRVLAGVQTEDPELRDTVRWLAAWDGRVAVTSARAALFELWCSHHLASAVIDQVAPGLPESLREMVGSCGTEGIVSLLEHPTELLGPNPAHARDLILLRTLKAAVDEMKRRQGSNRTAWQWGKLTSVLLAHPLAPLADDSLRLKMNVGPAPKSGDGNVVGVASYRARDFRVEDGASFRMVLDVGNWDDSVAVNTPGQSGDPSSPHYRDLFARWLSGQYFPLAYSRAAVEKVTERRIVLQAQKGSRQ